MILKPLLVAVPPFRPSRRNQRGRASSSARMDLQQHGIVARSARIVHLRIGDSGHRQPDVAIRQREAVLPERGRQIR